MIESYERLQTEREHTKFDHDHLVKHDLLALQQCASQQLANCVSNVSACNDGYWPLLPLAVPLVC